VNVLDVENGVSLIPTRVDPGLMLGARA